MRKTRTILVAALTVAALAGAAPGQAGGKITRLGTDDELDAPPSVDLTYLEVGQSGKNLEIRIGLSGILPELRAPAGAGIEWTFDVDGKTFVAEGHPDYAAGPAYTLFESRNGVFTQITSLKGSWEPDDGYLRMLVPLTKIGARRGTLISGTGPKGTEDVDIHQHAGPQSPVVDSFATTKDFRVR